MNNRGDIEFALRLRTDLEQGQRELQGLAQAVEDVGAAAATSSTQIGQIGETAEQQAARIRSMVEASLQQQAAADGMAESIQRSTTAAQQANTTWQQTASAQTEAMNAYTQAERAAEQKALADLKAAEAAKLAAAAVEKEGQELQQLLGKIDPVIRKLDELDDMEQQLRGARSRGQLDLDTFDTFNAKLQEQRVRLGGSNDAMRAGAISAGQYQQAMRQLPMQITDITTSLASGMPVWLVAVQQGGQIKDSFGGWANAGRALISTINPLTLAIAGITVAAGATIAAFIQGGAEAYEFEKAITLTGNASGVSADRLAQMAQQIDAVSGTQRQAAAVLAEVTAAGKFTADQIQLIGTTAVVMENSVGQAVSATVDQFKRLAEEPAEASTALNEQYNYLTVAVYEQIAALEAQGDSAGAAQLAMESLASAMQSRAAEISGNLGLIESAWKGIKSVATEAWDAMLDIGRADTLEDKLAAIAEQRQTAMYGVRGDRVNTSIDPALEARLQAEEQGLREQIRLRDEQAQQEGETAEANRQAIADSAERTKAADAFVKGAEAQLQSLQNLSNVQRAQKIIQDQGIAATSEQAVRMLAAAEAADQQKTASEAEAEAKRQGTEAQRAANQAIREAERANAAALRTAEQATLQQLNYVQGLEEQATKLGMTAAEVRQYDLAERGLAGAMRDRAQAALVLIDAAEQQRQADANAATNTGLEAEFLRAAGRETEAGLLEIRARFDAMRAEFEAVGNEAGLVWLDKLIPVAEARLRVDEVQREMERILAEQQREEQSVNVQQDAGLLSEVAAREQILDIHKRTFAQLQEMRPVLEEMARMPGEVGQAASNALAALDNQAVRLQATTTLLAETLSQGLEQGLSSALAGLANGTMDLEGAIRSLAQTVVQAMAQMAANQLAQSAMSGLTGLFVGAAGAAAGGGAGAAAAAGSAGYTGAFGFAEGGHVVGPGTGTSDSIRAALSNNEFVTRAAVVTQPGMLPILHDINTRGMAALDDWASRVHHNTGGLAGVPAPALPSPGMGATTMSEPGKAGGTSLKNSVNLYAIQRPEDIAAMAWGKAGQENFAVYLQQNGAEVRQLLGIS